MAENVSMMDTKKDLARRTEITISFNGKDISKDMTRYLQSFSFTDNEEGQADDVSITIDDREEEWLGKWLKEGYKGHKIEASIIQKNWNSDGKDRKLYCGIFETDGLSLNAPPAILSIKANAIFEKAAIKKEKKTKAWEGYTLEKIQNEIAGGAGYTALYLTQNAVEYERREQKNETDLAFLQRLCKDAGLSLKVTAQQLVIFSQAEYEQKESIATISKKKSDIISVSFECEGGDKSYKSCIVTYTDAKKGKKIQATFTPDKKADGEILRITDKKVTSQAEALALAKAKLRAKNKGEFTGTIVLPGDVKYLAGLTVNIAGFGLYDGKYIIEQATHTVTGGYTVSIKIRKALEGY